MEDAAKTTYCDNKVLRTSNLSSHLPLDHNHFKWNFSLKKPTILFSHYFNFACFFHPATRLFIFPPIIFTYFPFAWKDNSIFTNSPTPILHKFAAISSIFHFIPIYFNASPCLVNNSIQRLPSAHQAGEKQETKKWKF